MWATVTPGSKNNKLGRSKVARTYLVEPDSQVFVSDGSKYFKDEPSSLAENIMDTNTKNKLDSEAKWVSNRWSRYIISFIINKASGSPTFVHNCGKASFLSDADIVWSISNLPETVYWEALCYSIQEGIRQLKHEEKAKYLSGMEEILSPYFNESEECSLEKLCDKYGNLCTNLWDLKDCTISTKGVLVLFNWMKKVLEMSVNEAERRCSNDKGTIFPRDMIRAFNGIRLTQISSASIFPLDVQESNVACKEHTTEKGKKSMNKLPYLPCDLVQSEILPRLPYDSLLRFKSVCKNWREDITSDILGRLFHGQQANRRIQLFGIYGGTSLKTEEMKEYDDLEFMFIQTASLMNMYKAEFCSSCNGLICLDCSCVVTPPVRYAVGNPITGEWSLISAPKHSRYDKSIYFHYTNAGLAANSSSGSLWYKIVAPGFDGRQHLFDIFSSETSEWKLSRAVLQRRDLCCAENSVYVNGVLYWKTYIDELVWFDLDRDSAGSIALPDNFIGYPAALAIGNLEELDGGQRLTCSL